MGKLRVCLMALSSTLMLDSCDMPQRKPVGFDSDAMIIRLSEIEVDPNHLQEYRAILTEEASASVKLEHGVISIFPMYQKENPTQIRILEVYASQEAYRTHLKTPHFIKYKTSTLRMVKSLKLIDMKAMDTATMFLMFNKMKE